MDDLDVDVRVGDDRWSARLDDAEGFCGRVLAVAARDMAISGEVGVLLTADAEMRDLNHRWRGLDKPTDVLSFQGPAKAFPTQPAPLGDIAIGLETAMRDADAMARPVEFHVAHLLVHGFLHLLGYDHIQPEDADRMEPLEIRILAQLGWPDPYGDPH
ncbi:rRNA maturation RNase YbeY [bacterium]|nr:rRNA maturation RNase YbeY [bacterium]